MTDRQTDTMTAYRVSKASRGKNKKVSNLQTVCVKTMQVIEK